MSNCPILSRIEYFDSQQIRILVKDEDHEKILYFNSDEDIWHPDKTNLDFVAVALSHYASAQGRDLFIDGKVSKRQLQHIDEFLQIWSNWRPDLFKPITIIAAEESDDITVCDAGAVMAFSGGVDASFSLLAHSQRILGRLSQDISLALLIVGWDLKHDDAQGQAVATRSSRETLDHFGIRSAVVSTNWQQEFCPHWFMGFNIGVCSLLQTFSGVYSTGIMSSDHSYREELKIDPYGSHMVVNHLLGSANFPIITTGGTHTRLQRVLEITHSPTLLKNLRVCYQPHAGGGNCGRCEKCVRTQLEIIATGSDPSSSFPIPFEPEDIDHLSVLSVSGAMFLEEILEHLSKDSRYHDQVSRVAQRELRKFLPEAQLEAERQLSIIKGELAARDLAISNLKRSTSWRLTSPVRKVGRWLTPLRKRS